MSFEFLTNYLIQFLPVASFLGLNSNSNRGLEDIYHSSVVKFDYRVFQANTTDQVS